MEEGPVFSAFAGVDRMPDPAMLVRTMDETARWEATETLRRQAITWLAPAPGGRHLDAGCGPGDAAIALAELLGPDGQVVGVDASQVMVDEARRRASSAGVNAEFVVGDAHRLDFEDESFDGCRSERTLQWLDDPAAALAELKRVARPGGTVVVIDTDWGTFAPDHPDPETTERIKRVMAMRRQGSVIGRRLWSMFVQCGFTDVRAAAATHLATTWDPSTRPNPPGFPPMSILVQSLGDTDEISADQAQAWADQLTEKAREGQFFAALTMFAVAGRKPD